MSGWLKESGLVRGAIRKTETRKRIKSWISTTQYEKLMVEVGGMEKKARVHETVSQRK